MSVRAHEVRCSRCDAGCSAKRLIDLGTETVCPKCFDKVPKGLRRTLLRNVKEDR